MRSYSITGAVRGPFARVCSLMCGLCAALIPAGIAQGQCTSFDWLPNAPIPGIDGAVRAVVSWDADGPGGQAPLLVAGGEFVAAGNTLARNIAAWNGVTWLPLGSGVDGGVSTFAPAVFALAVYNNELIVGGYFASASGVVSRNVIKWNGANWIAMGTTDQTTPFDRVWCLGIVDGQFFLGCDYGGRVKIWNGINWSTYDGSNNVNGYVSAIGEFEGQIVISGAFSSAGGGLANNIARFDGFAFRAMGSGLPFDVNALAVYNNELYAGGSYGVNRWDGAAWHPLGSGVGATSVNPSVFSLFVYNNELHVGGGFETAGGLTANRIAAWNGDEWHPLGIGIENGVNTSLINSAVLAMCEHNGELVRAGSFQRADRVVCSSMARWNGTAWAKFSEGDTSRVDSLKVIDGELYAGGHLVASGSPYMQSVVRRSGGSGWAPLGDTEMNGTVNATIIYNGELIAGGTFTSAGGVSANRIAAFDGANWHALGGGMNSAVLSLAVYQGELYAGGDFSMVDGNTVRGVARWNGTAWQALGAGLPNNAIGYALTVFGGELIVGGNFATAGGVSAPCAARWNGTNWLAMGSGLSASVRGFTVYNGELVACGGFQNSGATSVRRVARWDGSSWQPFGTGLNGQALAITTYNNEVIVGGLFTTAGGGSAVRLARWNGSVWQAMGAGANNEVRTLAVHGGELFAGGTFGMVDSEPAAFMARWRPTCQRGDMNCDAVIDAADVSPFASTLLDPGSASDCVQYLADLDGDGHINGADIGQFVVCATTGCP